MNRSVALATAALVVAVLGSAPVVEAAKQHVIKRNSVTSAHIRNGTIQRADLARSTVAWLNAAAPAPRARGATVATGANGDRIRVHALNVTEGNVLGQMEYLGGLTCPTLGPWLKVEASFFDSTGVLVATGSDSETSPVPGVRYPLEAYGHRTAVRAELVASVDCL